MCNQSALVLNERRHLRHEPCVAQQRRPRTRLAINKECLRPHATMDIPNAKAKKIVYKAAEDACLQAPYLRDRSISKQAHSSKHKYPSMPTTHNCQVCRKSGLREKHQTRCKYHLKVFYYIHEPKGSRSDVSSALEAVKSLEQKGEDGDEKAGLQLLASGGYNDIWLVRRPLGQARQYVIRKPKEAALLPDQLRNEVAWLSFVREKLQNVPVPAIYDYSLLAESDPEMYFIAEEFVEGECLSAVWKTSDEATKTEVARQIAHIIVELAETTLDSIGGMMLDHTSGPTVEGMKLFKGRDKFHSPSCYDIGPYRTTKEYVLACYDKEIYYYSHAAEEDIEDGFFSEVWVEAFIKTLQATRQSIADDDTAFVPDEPFVLVHGDLHGRNIMMKDGRIEAILDWEFAGSYPLSELLGGMGVDVLEMETEEDVDENDKWSETIVELVGEIARSKGWDEARLALLLGNGNYELQKARIEMIP